MRNLYFHHVVRLKSSMFHISSYELHDTPNLSFDTQIMKMIIIIQFSRSYDLKFISQHLLWNVFSL
jgi:hypothetical protein